MNGEVGRGAERLRARWVPERKLRYYRVLGLAPGVSLEELKQTHRDLVKVWHPDRFVDDPRLQRKAQEKLKEINEAYEQILSDAFPAPTFVSSVPDSPPVPGRWATQASVEGSEPIAPSPPQATRSLYYRNAVGLGVVGVGALAVVLGLMFNENSHPRDRTSAGVDGESSTEGPTTEADPSRSFTLGSSQDEVLAVQGTPTSVEGNRWMYDLSSIDFSEGKVESYANLSHNLRVQVRPASDPTTPRLPGYFTLGSSQDEVLEAQGTPTSIIGRRWRYEDSSVDFFEGRVASYSDGSRNLHVEMRSTGESSGARSRGYFTLGSSPDEVLAIQGTPTSIEGSRWNYETASVGFSEGKVESYSNLAGNLRVQFYPAGDASAARARGYFTLGSSQDEVLAVQGTPSSVEGERWTYEWSWIKFNKGKVESYSNLSGNLRLRVH